MWQAMTAPHAVTLNKIKKFSQGKSLKTEEEANVT